MPEEVDRLILSTGAKPIRPSIEGLNQAKNVFTLRDVADAERIVQFIGQNSVQRAVIIGAGYNGTLGTAIVKVFDQTAAMTGLSEKLYNVSEFLFGRSIRVLWIMPHIIRTAER